MAKIIHPSLFAKVELTQVGYNEKHLECPRKESVSEDIALEIFYLFQFSVRLP